MPGDARKDTVLEPARETRVVHEADVAVLGGGPAGLGAALGAAQAGARTVLVERYGFLGGMGTAGMVTNFCGLFASVGGVETRIVRGVADALLSEIAQRDGLNDIQRTASGLVVQSYDTAAFKCAADAIVRHAGVKLYLHSFAAGIVRDGDRIDALVLENKSGRGAIRANVFVDCSGDADLVAWAGGEFELGGSDGYIAYPTMMFRLGGVESETADNVGMPKLRQLLKSRRAGELPFFRTSAIGRSQKHAGEWRANMTQVTIDGKPLDPTNADHLTRGELAGREQACAAAEYLRASIPGFERSYLLEIAPQLGIREGRRIVGDYVLTEADVLGAARFDDAIGCCAWPVEKHVLGGIDWRAIPGGGFYQIPYRCLLPKGLSNVLAAGRCLSATQDGQASARVSGPCLAMGQAAGIAAALAARGQLAPRAVDVGAIQGQLAEQGAFLGT